MGEVGVSDHIHNEGYQEEAFEPGRATSRTDLKSCQSFSCVYGSVERFALVPIFVEETADVEDEETVNELTSVVFEARGRKEVAEESEMVTGGSASFSSFAISD
jgi:hypothetical protein